MKQRESFAFCADHRTGYRPCDARHGHTWELDVITKWVGDHKTIRGIVGRVVISVLHKSYLNEIEGLPDDNGATAERVAVWAGEQLELTPLGACVVEVTELSASLGLVRHVKIYEPPGWYL